MIIGRHFKAVWIAWAFVAIGFQAFNFLTVNMSHGRLGLCLLVHSHHKHPCS